MSDDHSLEGTESPNTMGGEESRSPTRRRLLALLATAPVVVSANAPTFPTADTSQDPISRLFLQFEDIVAAHERALARMDRLEAKLIEHIGYSRVRLPTASGFPVRYAVEASSIDRHRFSAKAVRRLKRDLRRRQKAWDAAATVTGLTDATHHEEVVARAVRAIGALLLATPASTLPGLRLKLIVLLALHQPGRDDANASPWRELRLILDDIAGFQTDASSLDFGHPV